MKQNIRILTAAHDQGGMNTILPVIKSLEKQKGIELRQVYTGPAAILAEKQNLSFYKNIKEERGALYEFARSFNPNLIFLATSGGLYVDKLLIGIGKKIGVPVISIIDSWVNYRYHFSKRKDGFFETKDLPDYIFVLDRIARREMIVEGFPPERLVITGNPFFESFKPLPLAPRTALPVMLFADQHLSELTKRGAHKDFGFDEREVFSDIVDALSALSWKGKLLIKFHPGSKDRTRFDEAIRRASFPIVKANDEEEVEKLLRKSHIIIGMNSMVLFEAALRGKVVVSHQPHLVDKVDPLMSNRLKLSFPSYNTEELRVTLKKAFALKKLPTQHAKMISGYTKNGATKRVVRKLIELSRVVK